MKKLAKTVGTLGLVGCAVMTSPYAMADDSGWYGGVNLGQSRARIDDQRIVNQLLGAGLVPSTMTVTDKDNAFKLFGGYQFNKRVALEFGYFDLGRFGFTATTVPAGTLTGDIKLNGENLDVVGKLPVTERLSAFGRIGVTYIGAKDIFTSTGAAIAPANANPSKNAFNLKAGIGLQYDVTPSIGIRYETERYRVDDALGNKGDVDFFSVGLVYRFGVEKAAQRREPYAAAAPVLVVVPVKVKTQQYCSVLDIQFDIKRDEMQREEKEKLAVLGNFMKEYPNTTAVIEGHSDDVGESDFNMKLSQRRADSVVSYLVDTFRIDASRLTAVGYGETRPIADNSTNEGKQENRRINAVVACATDVAGLKVVPARFTMALEMEFDPYKSTIEPQYLDSLNDVAKFMKSHPNVTATVEGHAGKLVGTARVTPELAMEVSERRAQNVVNYLADQLGVPRSRLSTAAFGSTRRVSYGTSLDEQRENRRVNIIFNYTK